MKLNNWLLVLVVGLCVLLSGIAVFTAWNNGITLGLMGNIEHGSITAVRFVEGAPAGETIKVTIKNTGAPAVNILEAT